MFSFLNTSRALNPQTELMHQGVEGFVDILENNFELSNPKEMQTLSSIIGSLNQSETCSGKGKIKHFYSNIDEMRKILVAQKQDLEKTPYNLRGDPKKFNEILETTGRNIAVIDKLSQFSKENIRDMIAFSASRETNKEKINAIGDRALKETLTEFSKLDLADKKTLASKRDYKLSAQSSQEQTSSKGLFKSLSTILTAKTSSTPVLLEQGSHITDEDL